MPNQADHGTQLQKPPRSLSELDQLINEGSRDGSLSWTQQLYNDWKLGVYGSWAYQTTQPNGTISRIGGAAGSIVFCLLLVLCLPWHYLFEKKPQFQLRHRLYVQLLTTSIGAITYFLLTRKKIQTVVADVKARRQGCSIGTQMPT